MREKIAKLMVVAGGLFVWLVASTSVMAGEPGAEEETRVVPSASVVGDQPNILIMGEDADRDTVPRHSKVFNRVLNALISELRREGFQVYDETAVSFQIINPGRVRRTDAELITIARRIKQPPIDVIIPFQIYASASKNAYSDIFDLHIRIFGRMIDAQSGRRLGNYEITMGPRELDPLPVKCNRDCILRNVGAQAKTIAHEVGAELARKLADASPSRFGAAARGYEGGAKDDVEGDDASPARVAKQYRKKGRCAGLTRDYVLLFRGFSGREITEVEESLVRIRGFDHIRSVKSGARLAEYSYRSCLADAALNRKLRQMLDFLDLRGTVRKSGIKFTIDRNAPPRRR